MDTLTSTTSLFAYLNCSLTGDIYNKERIQNYSVAHAPLIANYHLEKGLDRDILQDRQPNMWRYREVLPIEEDRHIVSLGEGMTPILPFVSNGQLFLKDEAINPTGSFKARGLSMAISRAKELGIQKVIIPTAGNAGGAMSAYAARAGMEAHVYMPEATPTLFKKECQLLGAKVHVIPGTIQDCGKAIAQLDDTTFFNISTLKEPYRLEGKKTMGYEIAEQMNWQLPDVIIYPTGGGTGLIGIWKAFVELEQLGWIGPKRPRMVVVQSEVCDPMVKAWQQGKQQASPYPNPGSSIANGLRVPSAFGDKLILKVLKQSAGTAISIPEIEMRRGIEEVAQEEGILLSPEGSAVWKAYQKLAHAGWISKKEKVLLINTGSLYKYMENV